jgi:Zn-dependent protease with chaperone function
LGGAGPVTQDEFESLVKRLEQDATADPVRYRRTLGALALLGYSYIGIVVVALVGGTALVCWLAIKNALALLLLKNVGWALVVLVYLVIRALWIKLEPPRGRPLSPLTCPRLFELIETVRKRAGAPPIAQVLLTNEFNASVVQMPRLGVFGGSRDLLLLGLPLMQALSAAELEAVIAHEFGHLSGAHGRFGAWIYRLRAGWTRLLDALTQEQHWGAAIFKRFFDWYAPLFNAYSFVQARQQEYEADRVSVEAVGASTAASALLRVNVQSDFLGEKFWPAVFKRAETDPVPALSPFAMLGRAFTQSNGDPAARSWLSRSLTRRTGYDDTHPCLTDRLTAMGVAPFVPDPIATNAADALLGSASEVLQRQMDDHWRAEIRGWWGERHQFVSNARARLADLERQREGATLSETDLWERAQLTEDIVSTDRALVAYDDVLSRNPRHVGALLRRGMILLERDDDAGVALLESARTLDERAEQSACAALAAFHRRRGNDAEARVFELRYWAFEDRSQLARRERESVRTRDSFMGHGLEAEAIRQLADELARIPGLRSAMLVRKRVIHDPGSDLFVLGLCSEVPWWQPSSHRAERELVARVGRECRFPGETLIISLRTNKHFRKPLRAVSDSLIFTAAR